MKRPMLEEDDWRKGDLLTLQGKRDSYRPSRNSRLNRLSRFTFHAAGTALVSTLFLMLIFSYVDLQTGSAIAHMAELLVLAFWFLPDIISIPLIGALAAGCFLLTALRLESGNMLRNAAAAGMSAINGYLVLHGMLPLIAPIS